MNYEKDFLSDRSDTSLLKEIKRVAILLRTDKITQAEFSEHGKIGIGAIKKRFGTWNKAISLVGLKAAKRMNIPDEEIFLEIKNVWDKIGYRPSQKQFIELSNFSIGLLKQRFGSFYKALELFSNKESKPLNPVRQDKNAERQLPIRASNVPSYEYKPNKINQELGLKSGGISKRNKVFISYSHNDIKFLNELLIHLKPLERMERVSSWSDLKIKPGSRWYIEIQKALALTKVAVLLVSKDFLASDFIHESELCPLLKAADENGVEIRWVLIKDCNWKKTPLKDYQAAFSPDKPLARKNRSRDSAWVIICDEIEKALKIKPVHTDLNAKNTKIATDVLLPKEKSIAIKDNNLKHIKKEKTLGELWRGKWKNTYTHEGQTYSEDFEIFNGDQYFRYGVFKFNIVYFEQTIDGINFTKESPTMEHHSYKNILKKINDDRYEGKESNKTDVVYTRILESDFSDIPNIEKITLEQEFKKQKELAGNQFKQDMSILAYNMSSESCKRTYEMNMLPIIKKSIGEPVSLWEMGYFKLYLTNKQFCDYFNNDEVKMVYDKFYAKYPSLNPIQSNNLDGERQQNILSAKYSHDLFEKRKKVFDAVLNYMHSIIAQASVIPQRWQEFRDSTSDANCYFGFESDIVKNLEQIEMHASLLDAFNKELDRLPMGDKRTDYANKRSDQVSWFQNNYDKIRDDFYPYLDLSNIK